MHQNNFLKNNLSRKSTSNWLKVTLLLSFSSLESSWVVRPKSSLLQRRETKLIKNFAIKKSQVTLLLNTALKRWTLLRKLVKLTTRDSSKKQKDCKRRIGILMMQDIWREFLMQSVRKWSISNWFRKPSQSVARIVTLLLMLKVSLPTFQLVLKLLQKKLVVLGAMKRANLKQQAQSQGRA